MLRFVKGLTVLQRPLVFSDSFLMLADNSSVNASVPLKVVNTRRFYLPQTGDNGTWMFSVIGILLMAGSAAGLCFGMRKKNADHQ